MQNDKWAYSWSGPSGDGVGQDTSITNAYSLNFDGVDEFVQFGALADINVDYRTNPISMCAWVKTTDNTINQTIMSNLSAPSNYLGVEMRLNRAAAAVGAPAGHICVFIDADLVVDPTDRFIVRSLSGVSNNTWAHVAFSYDGSNTASSGFSMWINGSAVSITYLSGVGPLTNTTSHGGNFRIAERGNEIKLPFDGNLDECAVYDQALSTAQVQEIYNGGVPPNLAALSSKTSLIHWWRNGDGDTYPTISDNKGSATGTMTNMEAGDISTDVP